MRVLSKSFYQAILAFLFGYAFLFYHTRITVFPKWYENKRYGLYAFFLVAAFIFIFLSNKIFDTKGRESTGIGLINTKQRLDYLYKEKYDLRTDQSNGIYTVRLRLRN